MSVSLTLNKNIEILSKVQAGPSNKEWAKEVVDDGLTLTLALAPTLTLTLALTPT